ncbi:hypothetical protein NC661_10885 [Aquibacillus koreensis]|uniref:Uncharacterized protein n=1 Tax=Aquibacillus koreensis TaxID=279446 RepID=A0A9X3WJJ7_9BACI|nr:hypothetical protein [Aquibacillus koreensis]MCT2538181.1 hypothetical protein [Aquibacillus koreensis]MDC3420875.1 hypothetical protein [Aquibacillus koreensis]
MRKLLIVLFLLLITSFSVVGFISASDKNGVQVEQQITDHTDSQIIKYK